MGKFMRKRYKQFKQDYPRAHTASKVAGEVFGLRKEVRFIKSVVNAEKKVLDTINSGTVSNTGSITHLTAIAQGDDVNNRQGNSVKSNSIYGRFLIGLNPSGNDFQFFRIMIVCDKENTGTAPTVGDILQNVTVDSMMNVDTLPRYQILMDKSYAMQLGNVGSLQFKFYKPIKMHIKYTGSASTTMYKNNLFLLLLSDQSTNLPTIQYAIRYRYYDN